MQGTHIGIFFAPYLIAVRDGIDPQTAKRQMSERITGDPRYAEMSRGERENLTWKLGMEVVRDRPDLALLVMASNVPRLWLSYPFEIDAVFLGEEAMDAWRTHETAEYSASYNRALSDVGGRLGKISFFLESGLIFPLVQSGLIFPLVHGIVVKLINAGVLVFAPVGLVVMVLSRQQGVRALGVWIFLFLRSYDRGLIAVRVRPLPAANSSGCRHSGFVPAFLPGLMEPGLAPRFSNHARGGMKSGSNAWPQAHRSPTVIPRPALPGPSGRILVFTATYNERDNVSLFCATVLGLDPTYDVFIVDDASPDGTGQVLDELKADNPRLQVVHRPCKLGLGSAHKLGMIHAIEQGYSTLVTLDADFSHDPTAIPGLVAALVTRI